MNRVLIFLAALAIFSSDCLAQDFTTSNLPLIFIDTRGETIVDEPKITAMMYVVNDADGENSVNASEFEYEGYIGIEIRGNSSQMFDKKSFTVETRDSLGENRNVSLPGLPKNLSVYH